MKLQVLRSREDGASGQPGTFVVVHRLQVSPEERKLLEGLFAGWQASWGGNFRDLLVLADVDAVFRTANVREAKQHEEAVEDACGDFLKYAEEVREFGGMEEIELE